MENVLIKVPQENVEIQEKKELIFIKILAPQKLVQVKAIKEEEEQEFIKPKKSLLRLFKKAELNPKYLEELKPIERVKSELNFRSYGVY